MRRFGAYSSVAGQAMQQCVTSALRMRYPMLRIRLERVRDRQWEHIDPLETRRSFHTVAVGHKRMISMRASDKGSQPTRERGVA